MRSYKNREAPRSVPPAPLRRLQPPGRPRTGAGGSLRGAGGTAGARGPPLPATNLRRRATSSRAGSRRSHLSHDRWYSREGVTSPGSAAGSRGERREQRGRDRERRRGGRGVAALRTTSPRTAGSGQGACGGCQSGEATPTRACQSTGGRAHSHVI